MAILDRFLGASPQPTEPENATVKKKGVSNMEKPKNDEEVLALIEGFRSEGNSKPSEEEATVEPAVDADNSAGNVPASIFTEGSGEDSKEQFGIPKVPETSSSQQKTRRPIKPLEVPKWEEPNAAYSSQSESPINQAIQHSLYKSKAAKKIQETPAVGKYYEITCHVDAEEFEKLKGRKPDSKDRVIYCFVAPDKEGKMQILRDKNGEIKKASPYDFELYNFSVEELRQRQERINRDGEIKDAIEELKRQQAESNALAEKRIERLEELMAVLANAVKKDSTPASVSAPPASQQSK